MERAVRGPRTIVVLVVAAQMLVPLGVLIAVEPPARFGWQMFGTPSPDLSGTVVDANGPRDLNLNPYFAQVRADIDYLRWLPSHLCDRLDVERVTVTRGDETEELACTR